MENGEWRIENGEWRIDVSIEATECPQDGNLHNEENFGNKIEVLLLSFLC